MTASRVTAVVLGLALLVGLFVALRTPASPQPAGSPSPVPPAPPYTGSPASRNTGPGMSPDGASALGSLLKSHGRQRKTEGWRGGPEGSSAMDDSQTVVYELKASTLLHGWLQEVQPTLIARCQEHKTEIYLLTGMPMNPELGRFNRYTVRIRFDDKPARREFWSESTDHEAVFAPSPIILARQLAKANELKLELTPFNSSPQTVVLPVAGFQEPLADLAKACGWKP